ncbi:15 kDa protein B-like [Cynocephalus volans]|uniref:15 kDa protein B-like n=1 Tax=Cynocephalus volans TaxID=110931 RepID=UPI002FCBD965
MAGAWRALTLVVGLAVVACVAQHHPSYEEIVTQALKFYNEGKRGEPLFRLLEAIPPPSTNSTTRIPLNFKIKETVCISTQQRQHQECAFREGGEERICTGEFVTRRRWRFLALGCDRNGGREPEAPRVRRSAGSSEAAPPKAESTKLPPVVRDLYEKAKFDIIANILRNF